MKFEWERFSSSWLKYKKIFDFKPEIFVTHPRFNENQVILIDFNNFLVRLNSIKILMEAKLQKFVRSFFSDYEEDTVMGRKFSFSYVNI